MKIKIIVSGVAALTISGLFVASKLQLEETIVSARYEILACEGCNHMTIEKSKDGHLNGETIILISNTIDIEQLIDSVAVTKDPLCLRGKSYRFNWNFFGINPDGKRFEVTEELSSIVCAEF